MSSLKKQAIRGTIWTILAQGGSHFLRLGGNLILTRLLVPELFGLMALVNTFIMGIGLFSDIGIRPSIIRSQRWNDPVFLNTAWTLQVLRGFWIWLGCLLIAWPVSHFYGDSRLIWLIPIVGLTALISGFTSTSIPILSRKLEIGKISSIEIGTQFIGLTVMVFWAFLRKTIWALVGGSLISSCIKVLWSHQLNSEAHNRFAWEKDALKEIISFGKWIFVSTMMTFLASQADRLILGKLFSLELLGIYTIAFTMADLPKQVIQRINRQIMFPVISQYADLDRKSLREKILKKRWLLLIGLAAMVTFLVGFGDLLIKGLYDQRYEQAAWMLPVLALGLWPLLLSLSIDKALYAIGNPKFVAFGNFLKVLYMVILLPLGFNLLGILGAVVVVAFNDLPVYGSVAYGLWREKLTSVQQDILATLLLIGLITVVVMGRYLMGFGLPIDGIL